MPAYTISQLKTFVANIPSGANNWLIEVPDELVLPVVINPTTGPSGETMYTVKGYFHMDTHTWEAV